jgi:hypothetical protein
MMINHYKTSGFVSVNFDNLNQCNGKNRPFKADTTHLVYTPLAERGKRRMKYEQE